MSGGGIFAAVEVHTPCFDDRPLPALGCSAGHVDPPSVGRARGRCRVAHVPLGERLYFGSQRPDGRPWLQIGPYDLARAGDARLVSGVAGQLWVTAESGGGRVMVENLSGSVVVEIRSERLSSTMRLHPVDVREDKPRERWLGTPIAALQTPVATIVLMNDGHEFPIWTSLRTNRWNAAFPTAGTEDVRDRADEEIADAAMRIHLGSPDHLPLVRAFVGDPAVRERLRTSASLLEFLADPSANRTGARTPDEFCDQQLDRIEHGQATNELHRLILEGLGTPPGHASKHYTDMVRDLLDPQRTPAARRGGGGGLSALIPAVRARWQFRPHQLAHYLGIDHGPGRGPDLSPG